MGWEFFGYTTGDGFNFRRKGGGTKQSLKSTKIRRYIHRWQFIGNFSPILNIVLDLKGGYKWVNA